MGIRRSWAVLAGAVALVGGLVASTGTAAAAPAAHLSSAPASSEVARVCPPTHRAGQADCKAIKLLRPHANWRGSHVPGSGKGHGKGKPPSGGSSAPAGYYPADLLSAYNLASATASGGSGQTVAIVDAYNDPNAQSNLATYRKYFGLPPCTVANGCFSQVNQAGGSTLPSSSTSWSEEISLDLDMVSAICPNCHILLVEANSASLSSLGTAEDYAASHANEVSNSYGASEFSTETAYDSYYNHPGIAITASAGDSGYGVNYPAASPFVTAVGGTTLTKDSSVSRGWTETVWSGTGSGCSAYEPNPGWQPTTSACANRTVGDVAADANPSTGVAVYDTYGESGWLVFGGTSVASPITASVYALAGNSSSFTTNASGSDAAEALYSASNLNKVTSGSNTHHCLTYLCNAADSLSPSGYNGPTGNGTPNGTAGF